jgi:hypothetical protein
MDRFSLMHSSSRKTDRTGRAAFTARFMLARAGAFLLFLVIACGFPARAAQMEGPTVYGVDPALAVITNDGSEAYYVDSLPIPFPARVEGVVA